MKQKIELQKTRDFGEIVSDTFTFIFQNLRGLIACFFVFTGIFLLGSVIVQSLQQMQLMDTMNSINAAPTAEDARNITPFSFFNWGYAFISIICLVLTYATISTSMLCYIALYREKGNTAPTVAEVWGYVRYYFLRILGASFILGILLAVGFVLCLVPGIWLFPIFALVGPIIIMENTSFSYAFGQSFNLIKENWWITFGTLLVIGLITYLCSIIITLPVSAYNSFSLLIRHQSSLLKMSTPGIIISMVLSQLSLIFTLIPNVAYALCYFNLNEIKEGTGILGRINSLGQTHNDAGNLPDEEY